MRRLKCAGLLLGALFAAAAQQLSLPTEGVRLSTRLQGLSSEAYPLGLVWTTPEEKRRQQELYASLQKDLQIAKQPHMLRWLQTLPPTGRVRVAAADPAWLEANPKRNPLLQPQDGLNWPAQRSKSVRLLNEQGQACEVPYRTGLLAIDYLQACADMTRGDWAWVTQPDGRVQQNGLGWWNPTASEPPAPGAWVWVPSANSALPSALNQRWAQWLGTQGVSTTHSFDSATDVIYQARLNEARTDAFDLRGRHFTPQPSASHWGNVGLLQTPTARMRSQGHLSLSFHKFYPYQSVNVMFQPMDWMEAGFRYIDIENRLYSQWTEFSGTLPYKDKSLDLKLRAVREDAFWPEIAIGWRDVGGTGLFSSEYVVASKRYGRFDVSGGLAWGYLGGRGNIASPLSRVLGSKFDTRVNDQGQGGTFNPSSWFRGNAALMGGVEYQSPWNLVFKAELDGNHYQREPIDNNLTQKSPFNWGVVYRPRAGWDISAGFERGNRFTVGMTFYTDMSKLHTPKVTDPALPPFQLSPPTTEPDWRQTAKDLDRHTLWHVRQIYRAPDKVVVQAERSYNTYAEDRLDKAMAVLHHDAPAEVQTVEILHHHLGDVLAVERVQREAWVQRQLQPARTQALDAPVALDYSPPTSVGPAQLPEKPLDYKLDPGLDFLQTIGGPNGYLYQLSAAAHLTLDLPWNLKSSGTLRRRIQDNYDKFTTPGWSYMQPVRTQIREYLRTSKITLDNWSLSKSERVGRNWYASVYGGYFESMFGGVGGEVLYRQPGSRWAFGLDANRVRQRDFAQDFRFQDYQVNTGHLSAYWLTPFEGIHANLSVGQYLAGDRGATLSVTKMFANGSSIGAFASKTNVPAAVFGEGSFDKGIVWTIPFDAFLTSSSRFNAGFGWRPLIRDGAARVKRPVNLYAETTWLSPEAKAYRRAPPDNAAVPPDDRIEPDLRQ